MSRRIAADSPRLTRAESADISRGRGSQWGTQRGYAREEEGCMSTTTTERRCSTCRYAKEPDEHPACAECMERNENPSALDAFCCWEPRTSGLPWPAWLPPTLRAELVDYEQMAMGASETEDAELAALGSELQILLRWLLEMLEEQKAGKLGRALQCTWQMAWNLRDAMRGRP